MDKNKIILEKKKLSPARSNNTCKVRSIQHSVQHITFNKWKLKIREYVPRRKKTKGPIRKYRLLSGAEKRETKGRWSRMISSVQNQARSLYSGSVQESFISW